MRICTRVSRARVLLLLAAVGGLLGGTHAGEPSIQWLDQFGTPVHDQAYAVRVHGDHVYVAGATQGTLPGQTSAGGQDCYLRAYDLSGTHLWTRQFGSSAPAGDYDDTAIGMEAGPSGVYVCGRFHGPLPGQPWWGGTLDCFLRKYDHDGTHQWTDHFGTPGFDSANCMALTSDAVYTAGQCQGLLPGSALYGDLFIRKLSFEGAHQWTWQDGCCWEAATGLFADGNGIYMTGRAYNSGTWDVLVQKHDLAGNLMWRRQLGTAPVSDQGFGIVADPAGIYVAGYTLSTLPGCTSAGGFDPFVCAYTHTGNLLWIDQFGTAGSDEWAWVTLEGDTLHVHGPVDGALPGQTHLGGTDGFIRRYTLQGTLLDTVQYGTSGDDLPRYHVSGDTRLICGNTSGAFPGQTPLGGLDAFVGLLGSSTCTMAGLVDTVLLAGLPHGIQRSLLAKLDAAAAALARGHDIPAANQLAAFINECLAQEGHQIPAGLAAELVATATCLMP